MKILSLLKWTVIVSFSWIVLVLVHYQFIIPWKRKSSEESVKKSIQSNYKTRKGEFANLINYTQQLPALREIEFGYDGKFICNYSDTINDTYNWSRDFEGTSRDAMFDKFINYIGISAKQLDSLRILVEKTNCESISISDDRTIVLRYDGFRGCAYNYLVTKDHPAWLTNVVKLDEGIFCGLFRSEMFCGSIIYDK